MTQRLRRPWWVALAVVLVAVLALTTWVLVADPGSDSPDGAAEPSRPGTQQAAPPAPPAPPAQPRPVPVTVVKIDNVAVARPQTGLAAADVVYVEPVEGGFTRLAAVYSSRVPDVAGPVRSARETDVELLAQYGRPALVFSGAAPEIEPALDGATAVLVRQRDHTEAFFRDPARPVPHNLYGRLPLLPGGSGPGPDRVLPRGAAPEGGTPVTEYPVDFARDEYLFTWSPQRRGWLAELDGTPLESAGSGPVAPATVVVQRVDLVEGAGVRDAAGTVSPVVRSTGTGPVTVLRDGNRFEGTWSRPDAADGTRFTTRQGDPLPLPGGPVWVLLVPR
ncbi:DUF3048 domain-containing protein [Saccharomonospora piscinae]|uniref:DUF3048 domain-containing protein n=1 Tax=Saccharomonospora piscinae TaxID=687388 RepID=UPI0004AFA407|nr:DUF3048 domain-containing protein [Saccharomonospora piscinae]